MPEQENLDELKQQIDKRTDWINACLKERDELVEQFEAMGGTADILQEVE